MSEKKKCSELVLEEREKGNVVFLALDRFRSAPTKDIVAQPVDGLLWDLNREEETALTFMDRDGMVHWVNNFAVALVIRELKAQLSQLEAENEALRYKAQQVVDGIRGGGFDKFSGYGDYVVPYQLIDELADALLTGEQDECPLCKGTMPCGCDGKNDEMPSLTLDDLARRDAT